MMQATSHVQANLDAHPEHVVVDDPLREYLEGSLVDAACARQLRSRGVCTMPVVSEYFSRAGAAGFFKRAWGSGYPLSRTTPRHHCPITLYLDSTTASTPSSRGTTPLVHWRARLVPTPQKEAIQGALRFAVDTGQASSVHASPMKQGIPVDLTRLGAPDARGGWTVGGGVPMSVPMRGFYGFSLYGTGPGLRVAWAAASATLT